MDGGAKIPENPPKKPVKHPSLTDMFTWNLDLTDPFVFEAFAPGHRNGARAENCVEMQWEQGFR